MAIKHTEIRGSGEGKDSNNRDGSGTLKFSVRGSNSLAAVQAYVTSQSLFPETVLFGGRTMVYKAASWTNPAFGKWEFSGEYQEPDLAEKERRLDVDEKRLSFDTSGATVKVFTSLATSSKMPATAGDFKGMVGVNREGEAEGVDVVIPGLKITITARIARASVDAAYVKTLARLTGSVNDAAFYGFAAQEFLLLGATGEISNLTDPEIQFSFLASENVTGLSYGDITGVAKKGHEYIWIRYQDHKDTVATPPILVQRPAAVYVEQLYEPKDWTALGIGDSL